MFDRLLATAALLVAGSFSVAVAAQEHSLPAPAGAPAAVSPHRFDAATEAVNWAYGVPYTYDGAGNVTAIGSDTFVYDVVGRLVQADVNGIRRNYEYDAFGNRTNCIQNAGTPVVSDCQHGFTVSAATNRLNEATYNDAGNVTGLGGHTYTYDALDMPTRDTSAGATREYVYGPGNQRIATYTVGQSWHWTVRDPSGKVLREFTSHDGPNGLGTANWQWMKDYVWRDGLLVASKQIAPGSSSPTTYHYHLDHLGTPRRITDATDRIVGVHDYFAFGPEVAGGTNEPSLTRLKYTGHERDLFAAEASDTLDYMHARYSSPALGRFLSVDPLIGVPELPQSWNRYSYALNNPIGMTDPTGMKPCQITLTGEAAENAGLADGTVVEGDCSDVEADAPSEVEEAVDVAIETFDMTMMDIVGLSGFGNVLTGLYDDSPTQIAKGYGQQLMWVGPSAITSASRGLAPLADPAAGAIRSIGTANLAEKLALEEAMAGAGQRIMAEAIKDVRYPAATFAKMQHVHYLPNGAKITIHYWQNLVTGARFGFKFK